LKRKEKIWARWLTNIAVSHPWLVIIIVSIITIIAIGFAEHLEMRLNFKDLLPAKHPVVQSYQEVQERFGEASLVVALEGDRQAMIDMAEELVPELKKMESLYVVQGEMPLDYFRDHGFVLMKPERFKRSLKMFEDRSLVGTFRSMNDDYEREYTDSESNLKRDETEIARSMLGIIRSLEILYSNFAGREGAADVKEAADAFILGEPWMLSLDRKMLLISCIPKDNMNMELESLLAAAEEADALVENINMAHPTVQANLTGMARIGLDEMNSIGVYTQLLSLAALLFIYLLLAWIFKKFTLPLLALFPLIVGICWTLGLLYLFFGSLNMFTMMMMLILLGLGIDFSIHLVSRFFEAMGDGSDIESALTLSLSDTGTAIITGAMTTALAFFALTIADMQGIFEFGVACGAGILLTLIAIFITLPSLLVLHHKFSEWCRKCKADGLGNFEVFLLSGYFFSHLIIWFFRKRLISWYLESRQKGYGKFQLFLLSICFDLLPILWFFKKRFRSWYLRKIVKARKKHIPTGQPTKEVYQSYRWIGAIARTGWNKSWLFLTIAIVLMIASYWAMKQIEFEYDFLEMEPAGLKSVELQREIPKRFGIADHSAWLITDSIEESRVLKEKLRKKSMIGEVVSISDYIPAEERIKEYAPMLEEFRRNILKQNLPGWSEGDAIKLADELDRLWDNLDLMSNLAYTSGLDRIVRVIDQLTGYDTEANITDTTAVLPSLTRMLRRGVDEYRAVQIAEEWGERMTTNIYSMSDSSPLAIDDLPEEVRKTHLPRSGDGFLLSIFPRKYLFDREALEAFAEQTAAVHPGISGSEQLFLLMMDKTLEEGSRAAWLALIVIALLLLIHFRGPVGLLAMVPLISGALLMIGLMYLIGMKYNFMNMITVPIILGIGIDDGVHAIHRFRHQTGAGDLRIFNSFRFVGKAILLSSLTTMIGFGSVGLYSMRGMASFGQVLFMGVGACFLTTVFVLPAVLKLFYGKTAKV